MLMMDTTKQYCNVSGHFCQCNNNKWQCIWKDKTWRLSCFQPCVLDSGLSITRSTFCFYSVLGQSQTLQDKSWCQCHLLIPPTDVCMLPQRYIKPTAPPQDLVTLEKTNWTPYQGTSSSPDWLQQLMTDLFKDQLLPIPPTNKLNLMHKPDLKNYDCIIACGDRVLDYKMTREP